MRMEGNARPRFTPKQRAEVWDRWRDGQCIADIARALERRNKSGVYRVLALNGGISPAARRRAPIALALEEREEISRGIAAGRSIRRIAARLGRAPSTVTREVRRHGGRSAYRASEADSDAWDRALRPKPCRLASCPELRWRVVLKKELLAHLRTARQMRQAKGGTTKSRPLGQLVDAVSIRERPAEAEDRAVPGHWEGDLLSGANNTHMETLVARHSRFAMLLKVPSKDTATVVAALSKHVRKLPAQLRRSLTWDRGHEMAKHKSFTVDTNVKVYFCDPQSPWQRGTNENTNGLLRQYFPKKTDLSGYSQADLNKVALRLNQRPRKTLGFETPASKLQASVASTG